MQAQGEGCGSDEGEMTDDVLEVGVTLREGVPVCDEEGVPVLLWEVVPV